MSRARKQTGGLLSRRMCMTNSPWVRSFASWPLSIRTPAFTRPPIPASPAAAKRWFGHWNRSVRSSGIPEPSGWTTAASSSPAISICGPMQGRHAGLLTSRQADGQRLHRGVQQQAPRRMPERASPLSLGPRAQQWRLHEPCRCTGKAGGLAQAPQRRPTPQRDRVQDPVHAALSRRRSQRFVLTKPENSSIRRSKVGEQRKSSWASFYSSQRNPN